MQSIILIALFMALVTYSQASGRQRALSKSSKPSSKFVGLWSGVDPVLGSSLSLSINCYDDVDVCETIYSANPWNWTDFSCGGLGVVVQNYTLVGNGASSRLTAPKNGPIKCYDGTELSGYPGLNEFVIEPNGSIVWFFLDAEVALFEKRLWRTSCNHS